MKTNETAFAFKVVRHGGRRTDSWRTIWEGDDRAQADAVYNKHLENIRCGTLALVDNATNKAVRQECSGNWRTRP